MTSSPSKFSFVKNFILYTLFRLGLWLITSLIIIGIGLIINVQVPILVALILGVFIATPLSFVIGMKLRTTVLAKIIRLDSHRRTTRTALLQQLQSTEEE